MFLAAVNAHRVHGSDRPFHDPKLAFCCIRATAAFQSVVLYVLTRSCPKLVMESLALNWMHFAIVASFTSHSLIIARRHALSFDPTIRSIAHPQSLTL